MADKPVSAAKEQTMAEDTRQADAAAEHPNFSWYVLKVQSNREKSIKTSLERRIKREGLEEYFGEIVIPTQKVKETKQGKQKIVEHKLFPGYIMIHMELNDETWYLVRDTTGVGDFTGAAGKPIAMQPHEVAAMLGTDQPAGAPEAEPVTKIDLEVGEMVKIKEGSFEGFEGTIDAVNQHTGEITVLVEVFGRSTEVAIEHWQVEKI
jgi:transcriptional antiterminator NusG